MNLQEQEQLTAFLQQLDKAQAGYKDAQAQAMIADAFARQPDAAYLVVQRVLLLDMACKRLPHRCRVFSMPPPGAGRKFRCQCALRQLSWPSRLHIR